MLVKVPVLLSILLIGVTLARPQDAVADQQQELGMALAQSILKYVGVDMLASKDGNFSFKVGGTDSGNQEVLPKEIVDYTERLLKSFGHNVDADLSVNLMNANVKPKSSS